MDPDAKLHLALCRELGVSAREHAPDLDRALNRIERSRELRKEVVSGEVHEATAVLADQELDLLAVVAQDVNRGALVLGHQPAVADDIGGEDRSELSFCQGNSSGGP